MLNILLLTIACGCTLQAMRDYACGCAASGCGWSALVNWCTAFYWLSLPGAFAHAAAASAAAVAAYLTWLWWNRWRDERRRVARLLGAKTRALRDRILRGMRERLVPVPA